MLDFELDELRQNADWQAVLSAYQDAHHAAQTAAKATDQEFDGWSPRIMSVAGLPDETLPRIHGKLIAWGFLKFQLAGRGAGVVYQISPSGRQALATTESGQDAAEIESFQDEDSEPLEAVEDAA